MIESVLLVSRQGKTRLAKWYLNASLKEKTRMIRDITSLVLSRPHKQCNFIEFKEKKIVYKRYASLYFIACISKDENELITLEAIHLFVEVLDRYFGNVCELDIIFNFHKAYYILDELFIGGYQQESSKKEILRICTQQEDYMDESKEEGFARPRTGTRLDIIFVRASVDGIMATTKKSMATPIGRKNMFRATAGMTIDQQLQMASQLQAQGDDVLKTIRQMKKSSKNQKQTTKTNNLKFEWLQEHSRLKKLEENCSKELESLLLRMYNEASTSRESRKCRTQGTPSKKDVSTLRSTRDNQQNGEDSDDDNISKSSHMSTLTSTSAIYSAELEDLIRTEQLNRVALINQITSEREQRAALNQLLSALQSSDSHPEKNNQISSEEMQANVHQLIYDAVIGRQMVETTLEEQVLSCERDFNVSYRKVLETLRNGIKTTGTNVDDLLDQNEKIIDMLEAVGGNECHDEMLRLEVYDEYQNVFAELRDDLAEYEQEFIRAASANDAAGSIEAATCKRGSWSEPDEERFLKVLHSYDKSTGKKPQLLYDQLALVLPNVALLEIKKHVKFHQHRRFHQEKRKDRQREFQRKLEELQNNAVAKFRMAADQEQDRVRKMQQLSEMQQQCEQRHNQVSQWRVSKEAKERIEQQQLEIDQLLEIQKQQEEELRWKRKNDQQKAAVDEYKKGKAIEQMANESLILLEEQRREEERAIQSVVNAERVQYRQHEFQRKREETMQEEHHKTQLEEERLAKLNELKETTPYAQIISNIVPDPERTRQDTAAFRANAEAAHEGLPITETGLFPSHGYDCETLFKNARFKLGIALRNAGVGSSEYARQALANVKVCNVGAYRKHVSEPTTLW